MLSNSFSERKKETESMENLLAKGLKKHLQSLINEEPDDVQFRKAANNGELAKIKELWSVDIVNIQGDSSGQTALHRAAAKGYFEIVEWLLGHDADPKIPDFKGNTALHLAVNYPETLALLANHPQAKLAEAWSAMHKHMLKTSKESFKEYGICPPHYDPKTDSLKVYKGMKKS